MFDPSARATRIICTLGPACESAAVLEAMVRAGANVARLNFSHGSHQSHGQAIHAVREVFAHVGLPVAVLEDLQGQKVRCGRLRSGDPLCLVPGDRVRMGHGPEVTTERIGIDYDGVARHVEPGPGAPDERNYNLGLRHVAGATALAGTRLG